VPRAKAIGSTRIRAYRPFVRKKLALTAFNYGRVTVIPDLGPESSISVYSNNARCFVTEVVAEGHGFWQNWDHRNRLRVSRIDAEIPSSTARAFKHMILSLLSGIRPPESPKPSDLRIAGEEIRLFELDLQSAKGVLSGDVPREPPGPKTKTVESIFQLLDYYCGRPLQRRRLAVEIEQNVGRLFGPISDQ